MNLWRAASTAIAIAVGGLALMELPKLKWSVAGLVFTVAIIGAGRRLGRRSWSTKLVGAFVLVSAALMTIPGMIITPNLSPGGTVAPETAEVHYSITVSEGDRLSQGRRLFSEVVPHYGLVEPFILTEIERASGLLSFGSHVRFVQSMQILFCLAVFLCYWLWSRRRILPTALTFLPILAFAHTLHISIFCPNQSGWRFLGLALGLLLLVVLSRRNDRRLPMILGGALGALLVFNPETGLVVGAAYAVYLVSGFARDRPSARHIFGAAAVFASSVGVAPLAFALLFRLMLGYFPNPFHRGSSSALSHFAGGYGGLKIYFSISWIVILVHSIFEIIRAGLAIDALSSRRRVRLSVAVAILVWFGYFANRPTPWNLWTYWFLYGFLIVDLVREPCLRRYETLLRSCRVPVAASLLTMVAASGMFVFLCAIRDTLVAIKATRQTSGQVLSGVRLADAYANTARLRADFARLRSQQVSLLYFTSNTYLVPLVSGIIQDFPFSDPYVESFGMDDFERSVRWIETKHPEELLFDDPAAGSTGSPERDIFIARLKSRLSTIYRRTGTASAWEIWRLQAPAEQLL
jgi:hypothetical protein